MKVKKAIAREWLLLVIFLFVGLVLYTLDDYYCWRKFISPKPTVGEKNKSQELGTIFDMEEEWNFEGIKKVRMDAKKGYSPFKGCSEHYYLLFIPYLLCLFARSIIWSIKQLKK